MTRLRPSYARDVAGLCALVALALPLPAHAATVKAQDDECAAAGTCVADLSIEGARGERNDLTIRADGAGVVVTDAAAPLVADRNCVRREDSSVRCELSQPIGQVRVETGDLDDVVRATLPEARLVTVNLGDGDDRFEGEAGQVWAVGLGGNDVLTAVNGVADFEGRQGDDVLVGGPADDEELSGGPGRDRVSGGAGDDELWGADGDFDGVDDDEVATRDELDGGPGRDLVSYARSDLPVVVDLADSTPEGGQDVLRGIEDLRGSRKGDRLLGDAGRNRLFGEDGDDVLYGRGGDDFVSVDARGIYGRGAERAYGGPGNDDLRATAGGALFGDAGNDVLHGARLTSTICGPGRDTVRPRPGQTVGLGRDCERWGIKLASTPPEIVTSLAPPRYEGGAVKLDVRCPALSASGCILDMRVTTPDGRVLGTDRFRALAYEPETMSVRLPARAARQPVRVWFRITTIGRSLGVSGGVVRRLR